MNEHIKRMFNLFLIGLFVFTAFMTNVTPVFAANSTITFNSNGGTPVAAITQASGTPVSAPADPTRTNYIFYGWYSDASLTMPYTFTTMPASDITLYANWAIARYFISFNSNGGSAVARITQVPGTPISAPADPTRTGYTFGGWYSDASLTMPYTFTTMPAYGLTLYARWIANSETITFNSNGGTSVSSMTQDYDSPVSAPAEPTRTGYTFGGWCSDAGLSQPFTFTTMPLSLTLYAKWTANNYTISFNTNGGSAVTAITQGYGTTVSAPANPTRTGYAFGGWYSDAGLTAAYTFSTMPVSDITLYAKWTVASYTITFNSNGGSTVASITQIPGTSVSATVNPTRSGYTFDGWYSDAGLTMAYTFSTMPALDITLYGKWTANNYTMTFNTNGGSAVTAITQGYGSTVSAPANPTRTGYTFGGWYSDAGLTSAYTFSTMPASDITLYAKWTNTSYTLTYAAGPHGSISGTLSQTVNPGASGTAVTAIPDVGYHFVNWNDGSTVNPRIDSNVMASISVVATFAGPRSTKQDVLNGLIALSATVNNKQDGDKLDNAIDHLTKSLDPELWVDDAHLLVKWGDKAFNEEKDAVVKLCNLIKDKKSSISDAMLQGFVNAIVGADRQLAEIAIAEASDPKDIAKANAELAQGDSDVAKGNYTSGIEHYKNAWKQVTQDNNNQQGGNNQHGEDNQQDGNNQHGEDNQQDGNNQHGEDNQQDGNNRHGEDS